MAIRLDEGATVLYNEKTRSGAYRLGLRTQAKGIVAGHFYMLRTAHGLDPLLNRPLGAYRVLDSGSNPLKRPTEQQGAGARGAFSGSGVEFLYNVVGKGTALLAEKQEGDEISLLGPLGRGFPLPRGLDAARVIMVGGGIGVVPFYLLAGALGGGLFLFGARGRDEAGLTDDFEGLGCELRVSTEDGSAGRKGLVTDLLADEIKEDSIIYSCGPPGMLRAVAAMAGEAGAKCYVSLEQTMACGIGVCLGCAVKTKHKSSGAFSMVCSEGPVFDARDIDWDDLRHV
jgi:dihydroorotate dehydrogenase electron transfer subunit